MDQDETAATEQDWVFCSRCGRPLRLGVDQAYLVRIEAVSDPTPPVIDTEGRDAREPAGQTFHELLKALEGMSEREMLDQIHRRLTLHLCGRCYPEWIENPTGG